MATQVNPKELEKPVRLIRERAAKHNEYIKGHETRTRVLLIDPLLRALGWDPENPDEVQLEFKARRTPDYALMKDGAAVAVIEAKRLGSNLGSSVQVQVIQHIKDPACSQVSLVAFTNGDDWIFCRESGDWKDERVKISSNQTFETAFDLATCLSASEFGVPGPKGPRKGTPLPTADPNRKPAHMSFDDGAERAVSSWGKVYLESARYVVDKGHVSPNDFPVVLARTKTVKKCAMHTSPIHPNGKGFYARVMVRDGIWLDNGLGSNPARKDYSIRMLERFGVDPNTVYVEYAPQSDDASKSPPRPRTQG